MQQKNLQKGDNNQFPAIWSDEGKYLASVLGDALVKGLTQVSQERPEDPVEYLANFLRRYGQDSRGSEHEHKRMDSPAIPDSVIAQAAAAATATSVNIHNHLQRNPSLEEVAEMTEEPTTDEPENSSTEAPTTEETEEPTATQDDELPRETETDSKADDEVADENTDNVKDEAAEEAPMETEETNATPELDTVVGEESNVESQTEVEPSVETSAVEDDDSDMLRRLEKQKEAEENQAEEAEVEFVDEDEEEVIEVQNQDKADDKEGTGQRDERGQSVLHFAAARPGGAQTLLTFLHNPEVNLAWRDERLKTARDVASSMHRTENIQAIDNYIISKALGGEVGVLQQLLLDGYDYINECEDEKKNDIMTLTEAAGQVEVVRFLNSVSEYQENLDSLMDSIRMGDLDRVKQYLEDDPRLAVGIGKHGRTPLHVAVLCEEYSIVQHIAQQFPKALKKGDNMERTALHYAMGIEKVEKMTRILVRMGAKRVLKDIRGRQPSYYFINREEIAILQEEEKSS